MLSALLAAAAPARGEGPDASPSERLMQLAREAGPGLYPRWLTGEQAYWTVVGAPGDAKEAALSEDGLLELEKQGISLEPFLFVESGEGGGLVTWHDARASQSLEEGWLPIPAVTWQVEGGLALRVRAFAAGAPGESSLFASYRIENGGDARAHGRMLLALRPIQVLPTWQFLNLEPGFAPIREIAREGDVVRANGKALRLLTPPDGFGALAPTEGELVAFLREGRLPEGTSASDAAGFASAALRYDFDLAPGAAREVHVEAPFHDRGTRASRGGGEARIAELLAEAAGAWRSTLSRVRLELPPEAGDVAAAVRSSLGWILVHRDGPRIQPGSRNYERSWIRDGALTSAALLAFGFDAEVEEFLRWYAPHQFDDGKVPCCVDGRGPDPTPEHDSPGELVFALAEHYRFARDRGLVRELWPHVVAAVEYLDALRRQRRTDEYRAPDKVLYFGLLPESISHEGYAERPVHSYWDDLFALRGFRDAAFLAGAVGDEARARAFAAMRDEFQRDLVASYLATMRRFELAHLPASADLGDFDPTATAVWLETGGDPEALPSVPLARTFDGYWAEFERRGAAAREAYAPYELRIASAYVRLGQRERAAAMIDAALADRRPRAWNQWPEILWRDPRAPRWLGDLPHGWIAATFAHAVRTMLVHERERDGALVVAAGVPLAWLAGGEPLRAERLPTWWGELGFELRAEREGALRARVFGDAGPPGGIVLAPPLPRPLREVESAGLARFHHDERTVTLGSLPVELVLRY
jgi:hypothetical protein